MGSSTKLAFTMEGNLGSASILDEVDGIFTARFDGVNKELWANGLLDASTAHSRDKVDYSNNNSPLAVGGYFSSATNVDGYMKGDISEILVFNRALTPAEQQGVNYYLSTKWGLGSVVDSDADGFTDAAEVVAGTSPTDASSNLIPDLSVDMTGKPAILADAKLWLDASNVDGYNNISLSDGDAVSTWTDLSGNGNDAAPKGSANQPTYKGDKVYFDGSNDYLRIPISANDELDVSNKSFTAFLIYKPISNSNTTVLISNYENSTTPYWGVSFNSQNHFGFNARESSSNSNSNSGGYLSTNQVHLLTASFNEDTGKSIAGFDGNHNVDEDIWTSGSFINISKNPNLIIGSGHLNRFAEGEIMEVLLFNSDTPLTPQQIIDIQSYLSQKWGLNSTVDSDGDGFTDAVEIAANTSVTNANETPLPTSASSGGLIARYTFDNAGNLGADSSGNGRDLTTVAVTRATGRTVAGSGAANFDGATSRMTFPNIGQVLGDNFSISFWLKNNSSANHTVPIYLMSNTSGAGEAGFILQGHNTINFNYWTGRWQTGPSVTGAMDNEWHHLVVTIEGDDIYVYKDGELHDSTLNSVLTIYNHTMLGLGANMSQSNLTNSVFWFYGQIDDVQIVDTKLSGAEVAGIYNAAFPDLSDKVDALIGEASNLDAVESSLKLWVDASTLTV